MDILDCAHLKLKFCSLIWRHVQLRLSYEYHWTKHNEVAFLSVTRNRHRSLFSKVDCILLDQILLDSSTYLLPPSSRDLHRLRFCLQNGEKTFHFQAPDEVTYEMWRVAIVDAISETAEMEQRFQTGSIIDIDVKKIDKDGNMMLERLDQAKVYIRDATNSKLIRLHQPVAFIAAAERNLEQTLNGIQCEITAAKKTMMFSWLLDAVRHEYPAISHCNNSTSSEEDAVDATVSVDAAAFDPLFGHLGAVGRQHKYPDNHEENASSVSSHTAIISENHEQSSASTLVRSFPDGEEEVRELATPMQTEVYLHTVFSTSANMQRSRSHKPTARESIRRRLMETDARKHGMVPCHSTLKQPEEELDGIFDTVHPYLNFA